MIKDPSRLNRGAESSSSASRYLKLKDYWQGRFGGRVQKISLNAGLTCPNRDGTLGTGGCLYCSNEAFTPAYCHEEETVSGQIEQGYAFARRRYPRAVGFMGYLQAYTNTYGPLEQLIETYQQILDHPRLVGLVIGTRPDCLPDSLLSWLVKASEKKAIYIELGIESFSNDILNRMNRGHSIEQAEEAVVRVAESGLPVGGHFLVGFPGEPWESFFDQVDRLNALPLHSIKVHHLHVFRDTPLARIFQDSPEKFEFPSKEAYMEKLLWWLPRLRPDLYIDRVFGDAPIKFILNPVWGIRLDVLIRQFEAFLEEKGVSQGELFEAP